MAVETDGSYSFHRFYMGITKTSLRPAVTGVGYKALFMGGDAIKGEVASYGYSLQLEGGKELMQTKNGFVSGKELTLRIQNYDVENYGDTKLIAKAILVLNDGTVIESATYTTTLRSMVETINANMGMFTAEQLLAVKNMLSGYELDWSIDNILSYEG